jgi:hypothetical protein
MQQKRGLSSRWASVNPTLLAGELGIETDTNKMKVGDGSTAWNSLPYTNINAVLLTAGNNDTESLLYIENATIIDTVVASQWRNLKYVISMSKTSDSTNKFATTAKNPMNFISTRDGVTGRRCIKVDQIQDYHSHNALQLNIDEMEKLLLKLPYIRQAVFGEKIPGIVL